jgi:hypothetical protein
MRLLLAILFFILGSPAISQDEVILLRGKITDKASNPIPDAHIINYRNLNIALSNEDGSFRMFAHTGDSLMVTHIAYEKKKVYANDIQINPEIQLVLDTINIALIEYHQNKKDDIEIAEENIKSILEMKFPPFVKIKTETEPVYQMVMENNRLMRTEAASVTFLRFSPSVEIGKLIKLLKKKPKPPSE